MWRLNNKNDYMRSILFLILFGLLFGNCSGGTAVKKDATDTCKVSRDILNSGTADTGDISSDRLQSICRDTFMYDEDGYKYTKLGLACKKGDLESVKRIISEGANTERCSSDEFYEYDVIYVAVLFNQVELVRYFVGDLNKDVNQIYNEDGLTLLSLAAMSDDFSSACMIAKILVDAGADVNGSGDHGADYIWYPLFEAVKSNNIELLKYLISNGADVNSVDRQGGTIYILAEQDGRVNNEMKEYIKSLSTLR